MEICERDLCTGCMACVNSCPKECIDIKEDEIGHIYPHIDENKCVNCGKCKKICPVNTKLSGDTADKVYACWSKDIKERESCTSGGLATVISRNIINDRGAVYGSALTQNGIQHIRVEKEEYLERLKGSKYVQSPVNDVYIPLKNDLENDKKVLFIGTPCQCAGIKAFLGKEYENLYIIDLICTGVPPQKLLWEHLGGIPDKIRFRDEDGTRLTVVKDGNVVCKRAVWEDYFLMNFSKHLCFRKSCYSCPFAKYERHSDITLGDFWGLGKTVPFKESIKGGVSAVFINTQKGRALFEGVQEEIFFEEREIKEAIEGNPRYITPSAPHRNRSLFIAKYKKEGFKKALCKALRMERIKYFVYRRKRNLKNLIK